MNLYSHWYVCVHEAFLSVSKLATSKMVRAKKVGVEGVLTPDQEPTCPCASSNLCDESLTAHMLLVAFAAWTYTEHM